MLGVAVGESVRVVVRWRGIDQPFWLHLRQRHHFRLASAQRQLVIDEPRREGVDAGGPVRPDRLVVLHGDAASVVPATGMNCRLIFKTKKSGAL